MKHKLVAITEAIVGYETGRSGIAVRAEFDPQFICCCNVAGESAGTAKMSQQLATGVIDSNLHIIAVAELSLLKVEHPE